MNAVYTVSILSFCTLLLELAISRLSVFYLDYGSSFLAIPLTLLGLAIGSLHVHLRKKPMEEINIRNNVLWYIVASFISFAVVFLLFSNVIQLERNLIRDHPGLAFGRTIIFTFIFIPPFYFAGKNLTVLFTLNRERIGKIYGADLIGAAIACFIAPFFFHFFDLPYLILFFFVMLIIGVLLQTPTLKMRLKWFVGLFVVCAILTRVLVFLEGSYNLTGLVNTPPGGKVVELLHRWNEYSRVSLLKILNRDNSLHRYRIIHDNAESNVVVKPFTGRPEPGDSRLFTYLPLLVVPHPSDILVMFAGCGAQMVELYQYTGGIPSIDGVEINPLCKTFAESHPDLESYRLKEFYDKPNVNLHIMEGRRFLLKNKKKYDIIMAASDAATSQYKTGHSRKFLDTYEAMASYFEHLNDNGILSFHAKPAWPKIDLIRTVFDEQNIPQFENSIIVLSELPYSEASVWQHMIIKKGSFTPQEVDTLIKHSGKRLLYAPYQHNNHPHFDAYFKHNDTKFAPKFYNLNPTDDRPYYLRLDFKHFNPVPGKHITGNFLHFTSWMKIQTLFVILLIPITIMIALVLFTGKTMPSPTVFTFLVISGFCYMLCQIVFIGKLELFLENPLFSMALLISIFLFTNGFGSTLVDKLSGKINIRLFPFIVAGVVLVSFLLTVVGTKYLLTTFYLVKILYVIVVIAPVGLCLGFFYPYAIQWLNKTEQAYAVPVTYGISTLSSVMGATYAMTMIINLGYSNVLIQAIVGYFVLGVFLLIAARKA